jgi:mono/diheme cytochrome c family protein
VVRALFATLCITTAAACAESPREDLTAQPSVPGTVARERAIELEHQPPQLTLQLLRRGQQRYAVDCAVCHGPTGDADTPQAQAFKEHTPASLHDERVRALSDEALFELIGKGTETMVAFPELSNEERWAIVGYVRALQLSAHAPLDAAPPDVQARLSPPAAATDAEDQP